jgi:hypothetical protein
MSDDRHPTAEPPLLEPFLSTNATWRWRAWGCFGVALCLCTMQAVPGWTHPSLHLGWDPKIWYAVIAVAGALAGSVVAGYRLAGMLAGAIAGVGSVLSAVLILEQINPFSRIVLVAVGVIGLLPGVALYLLLHIATDRLTTARRS